WRGRSPYPAPPFPSGGAAPPAARRAATARRAGSLPFERSLLPLIDEADGEHAEEDDHRPEAEESDPPEPDRPGQEERHLEVENDEEDGDEIVADIELAAGVVEGLEAALIGGELLRIRLLPGHHH